MNLVTIVVLAVAILVGLSGTAPAIWTEMGSTSPL